MLSENISREIVIFEIYNVINKYIYLILRIFFDEHNICEYFI